MPAFTSRLSLYKPGNGVDISPDETADIQRLNDNFDLIDDSVGAKIVTSGTRPATPYSGQVIFETDTGDFRVRSGSSWVVAGRSDRATWNVADLTALAALSGTSIVKDGDLCVVQEGGAVFVRTAGVWVQETVARFATTAVRDTAYAKAAGAYLVAGVEAVSGGIPSAYSGSAWTGTVFSHRQLDTTNDSGRFLIQHGIGRIAGATDTRLEETVTFPQAFASTPTVVAQFAGARTAGAFNPTSTTVSSSTYAHVRDLSTTSFIMNISRASNMSVGIDYYYTWIAMGVSA